MSNLYNQKFDLNRTPVFYPDSFVNQYQRYVLKTGDLIMSLTGTMGKEDYGYTVKIPEGINVELLLNQRVTRIFPNEQKITKDFVLHYFQFRDFLQRVFATAKGAKQANLSTYLIGELFVPTPPRDEQLLIADILNKIEDKINLHSKKRQILEDLFKTLLKRLVNGEIRVSELDLTAIEANPLNEALA